MEINIYPGENVTGKIQNAIDEVSANGGGTVILNDGEYLLKSILLKSGVCLYLKSGVLVKGSRNVDDYDLSAILIQPEDTDYTSVENCPIAYSGRGYVTAKGKSNSPFSRWSRALIKAYRAKNISIIGEQGATFDGQNVYDELGEENYRGPHFLNFHECENVHLKGYTLKHSGNWGNNIWTSHRILIEDLTVLAGHDGIDIMSCDDVVIRNCDLQTGDDCIAGFDNQVVLVENCKLNSACNALRIGGNTFRVRNCEIYGPGKYGHRYSMPLEEKIRGDIAYPDKNRNNTEAAINYYCDDRFKVRLPISIQIEDCTITNCDKLLDYGFTDEKRRWIKNKPMEMISFKGVTATGMKGASELFAPSYLPLEMECKDCHFEILSGEFAKYENTNFTFENVTFAGEEPCLKGLDGSISKIEQVKKD